MRQLFDSFRFYIRLSASFPRAQQAAVRVGTGIGAAGGIALVMLSLYAYTTPANTASAARSIPDELSSYCSLLAFQAARSGTPLAPPCGTTLPPLPNTLPANFYGGDQYDYGNCTYWVSLRRMQIGEPIPNTWGDAYNWADAATYYGYIVNHIPTPGAIMQTPAGSGHVAFVENVEPNGTWHISEMNAIGFDEVDYRSLPGPAAAGYDFIH